MDTKLSKYKSFRDVTNRMLYLCGVWPHLEETWFYYRIVAYTAIFMCTTNGVKLFGFCLANVSKISVFVNALSTGFGIYTLLIKVVSFLIYREDLALLDKELGGAFEEELENKDNRPILLQGISVYSRFLYGVSGLVTIATITFYNPPIVHALRRTKYEFSYEGEYPFPVVPASPLYWFLLLYETSSVWFTFNVTNGVDISFGLHCFRACGLLRLMTHRWEQLQPSDSICKQQIRDYVQLHQLVTRSTGRLEKVYGYIVLWNYVTISIILCSLLWQANQIKNDMTLVRVIYFTCYITFKSLQAFTYAYYSSLVSQESENHQDAIFFSNWPGCGNVQLMKELLIIYTQRIIMLKASGFFLISMEMFEKILNTAISYFFLMLTIESKD